MLSQLKPTQTEKPLQCPACDAQFWLTWRRYLSPIGWQSCPSCGETSRNNRPIWTHVYLLLGFLVGLVPAGILHAMGASFFAVKWAFLLVGSVCALVLDRHLDARLGKLVPFKPKIPHE